MVGKFQKAACGTIVAFTIILASVLLQFHPYLGAVFTERWITKDLRHDAHLVTVAVWKNEVVSSLNEGLQNGRLSVKEIEHLADVAAVVMRMKIALLVLAIVSWYFLSLAKPDFTRFLSACYLILITGPFAAAWLNWRATFIYLHVVLFPNNNWIFKKSDYLIQMYPPEFWISCAVFSLAVQLILVVGYVGWNSKKR